MATLIELQHEIDARMRDGASFSSIEDDMIEPTDLSAEEKSALWLYAWSFVDALDQRREALAHIAALNRRRWKRRIAETASRAVGATRRSSAVKPSGPSG